MTSAALRIREHDGVGGTGREVAPALAGDAEIGERVAHCSEIAAGCRLEAIPRVGRSGLERDRFQPLPARQQCPLRRWRSWALVR
ncbi:MAG: hypothetical protein IT537_18185 [Hyphomicrobiales bacterium]|nr:hypothetical protein [Hyphomicrobiales bacterium]